MFQPKHIKRWREQINFEGKDYKEYYVAYFRFFRASSVERSNYKYIKDHLLDCGQSAGVVFPYFTDEVYMCRYYIMVHESNEKALKMADMFAARVKAKGSLDPEQEHKMDIELVRMHWLKCSVSGRVKLCQDSGMSIFAARYKALPYGKNGIIELIELITEVA